MPDIKLVTVNVAVRVADDVAPDDPPANADDHPVCDLWSMCNDPLCFSAGCRTVLSQQNKGVRS